MSWIIALSYFLPLIDKDVPPYCWPFLSISPTKDGLKKEREKENKMTRGNQRELAREKNLKKQAAQKKSTSLPDGMNFKQKQEA